MPRPVVLLVMLILWWGAPADGVSAAETTRYFRSDRGVAADDNRTLPQKLDDSELVWRTAVAPGHSSPCLLGTQVVVTTFADEKLHTVSLDQATGQELWRQAAPAERLEAFHASGSPAASTPASDGQRVYVFFGSYGLLCYDQQGQLVWSRPFAPFQDEFGSASSPVLIDRRLILNEDHDINSFLVAVDPATGDKLWQAERPEATRSYATPVLWNVHGRREVVVSGALQLTSYDPATGRQLWTLDGWARIVNTTPAVADDLLVVSTWSPGGDRDARISMDPWDKAVQQWDRDGNSRLSRDEVNNPDVLDRFFRIDINQDQGLDETEWTRYARVFERARNVIQAVRCTGPGAAEVVWSYDRGLPYVASPLVYRDVVYLVKDGGILTTLDLKSGKPRTQGRLRGTGSYYASPVAGDGRVYVASRNGVVTILSADGQHETLGERDFAEEIVATPMLADGRLYLRTQQAVYCFARQR